MNEANFKNSAWINTVLIVWFSLTVLSVIYVAWDAFTSNPELTVMKWGWLLVTLYTGVIGAALYILSCKEPAPMQHEEFVKPLWKQTLGSTIHCLAGDATGIIVAAAITMTLGLPMWLDVISEYFFGFAFGLFVFQSLFMKDMLGGSYLKAVRRSFMPEWLSMNAVMAGMIPVMVILMSRDMTAMEATSIRFWGVMSLATLVGFIVAFPVNMWLVAVGLKHGMGTVRALGKGGHSLAAEREGITATSDKVPAPHADTDQSMEGM
ncbi:multicopper oxidase [Nostoc linckia z18]|uniref:Multicopper oxidase n=3 Tax=Nostoc linckia TaxID=92942 RepID=A0A9Q5ZBV6_NOSLI|nr:multicopper oxidase [Nostoc linckia z3]PHJ67359.1 multicopper oxidase [Nostoc linckia z1]PHJ76818.1 multicopper oxidase [Nostoc linckia z2]PHJ78115.1 multicopper oxidase [Nostoc linckia z4]PHJ91796.1 multicopper oxidase [Nostoc linckia z6]PHJ96193.1 multicopper oxidase [Nostoc linckia z7]PHK03154.1 multicopper oxidase [Nostoc linckia z8]PHK13293.1 multicopper oxidase [Nostoc linckia z9]PHK23470.1 multicopper oxidase [Nostoc linckia z14]PHK27051.1 multicopper oxidase [Nostoc linckia z13]